MATVSRFNAVAQVGKLEFGGFIAWLAWLGLHLYYLVGYRNRLATVVAWLITFLGRGRGQMAITSQMIYARVVTELDGERKHKKRPLAAAEQAEKADKQPVSSGPGRYRRSGRRRLPARRRCGPRRHRARSRRDPPAPSPGASSSPDV